MTEVSDVPTMSPAVAKKLRLPSTNAGQLLAHIVKHCRDRDFRRLEPWCEALARAQELGGDGAGAAAIRAAFAPDPRIQQMRPLSSHTATNWSVPIGAPKPIFPVAFEAELQKLLRALRHRHRLVDAGVDPPTRILFSGPSGTGKTMTATYLASELGVPLGVVQLDRLVGSHLGETSERLRAVFAELGGPSVLLLDEIDCTSIDRLNSDGSSAARELARATASLFQQLDGLELHQIVIAATNLPDALDGALRRRMPVHLEFEPPDKAARLAMMLEWLPGELGEGVKADIIRTYIGVAKTGAELRSEVMRDAATILIGRWEL